MTTIGLTFRSIYADTNALWIVRESRGRGTWLCEIVNEPIVIDGKSFDADFAGTKKAFLSEDIDRAIGLANFWKKTEKKSNDFFGNLKPGQILHYRNGHNQWVRCEVVKQDTQCKLKPLHLVGEWSKYELPHRQRNGDISYPYYPAKICGQTTDVLIQPHESCIYESKMEGIDPRSLPAIALKVLPLNKKEQADARKWKAVESIKKITENTGSKSPQDVLDEIHEILNPFADWEQNKLMDY